MGDPLSLIWWAGDGTPRFPTRSPSSLKQCVLKWVPINCFDVESSVVQAFFNLHGKVVQMSLYVLISYGTVLDMTWTICGCALIVISRLIIIHIYCKD